MSDLWSVAITEADWKWLEVRGYGWLNKALGAVHGPDTDRGMSRLPLYTEELRKLVSEIGTWGDDCPGLLFALNTAVPAPHNIRMAREWSDRNGEWMIPFFHCRSVSL